MATLTGQRIKDSYKDLLQVSNSNSGIDSTLRAVSDGEATSSLLQLSTVAVNISSAGTLQYAGVAITSTAAELNILDGATVTVAELNVLDGYTGSVTELNYLDTLHATGVTNTEFDYLDGVTSSIQVQLDATFDTVGTGLDTSGTTISLDLNELGTETSIADADFLVMVDATDDGSQKITFENLEDAIFSSVSGDITITEAGVAAIQANSVVLATDTTGNYVATVADSGDGGITVANSGSENAGVTLELDVHGLTTAILTSGDFIAFSDEDQSGDPSRKESIDDIATLFAGTGLTASSAVIGVDAAQTQITSLGTIGTGVWNGTAIASAYLDADTAHLSTTQTFSGAKTFSATVSIDGHLDFSGTDNRINNATNDLKIVQYADDKDIIFYNDDGSGGIDEYFRFDGSSEAAIISKNMAHIDDVKARFGTDDDFEIYSDNSNSYINSNTQNLIIEQNLNDGDIVLKSDDGSGGTTPYLTLDGSTVRTDFDKPIEVNDSAFFADDSVAYFGTGSDLRIWHNGSDSYIYNYTVGSLIIGNTVDDADIIFVNDNGSGGTANYLVIDGGAVAIDLLQDTRLAATKKLYLDGGGSTYITESAGDLIDIYAGGVLMLRIEESGTDSVFTMDNVRLGVGSSKDMVMYHDGTNSYIDSDVGSVNIRNILSDADINISVNDGGSQITALQIDASEVGRVKLPNDGQRLVFGASDDLHIEHSTHSYISNNTGDFIIQTQGTDSDMIFKSDDGSGGLAAYLTLDGGSAITTVHKIMRFDDSIDLRLGAGSDLRLYHNGTNSYVDNYTGDLYIRNTLDNKDIILQSDDGSGGTTAYLTLDGSAGYTTVQKRMRFDDDVTIALGTSPDTLISSNGSNTFFDQNIGSLFFRANTDNGSIHFQADDGSGGLAGYMDIDGTNEVIDIFKDVYLTATKKLYLDTGGDTYIHENSADSVYMVVGGVNIMRFYETSSEGYAYAEDGHFIGVGSGIDFTMRHDGSNTYLRNNTGNLYLRNTTSTSTIFDDHNGVEHINVDMGVGTIFNEGSADLDFRVESNGDANCLFVNGGTDRVGIGIASPSYKLEVNQDASVGALKVTGGGGGAAIARFVRDVGGSAYVDIGCGSDDPQVMFTTSSAARQWAMGVDSSTHKFLISENSSIAANDRFCIDDSGLVGIGTTSPGATLEVNGTGEFRDILYIAHGGSDYAPNISFLGGSDVAGSNAYENATIGYYDNSGTGNMLFSGGRGAMNWHFTDADETLFLMTSGGDFHAEGTITADSSTVNSDRRLKENINPIPYGLEEVLKMNPVEYDWKEKRNKAHDIGVIAQEIEKIIPEVVQENKDLNSDKMIKSVDYSKMVAVLIKAVQEQQVQIDELKTEIGVQNG